MSRSTASRGWPAVAITFVALSLGLSTLPAIATDLDPPSNLLEHRRIDAEAKARAMKTLLTDKRDFLGNHADYDVTYYKLEVDIRPDPAEFIYGTVTIHATVVAPSISVMDLDLDNSLVVSSASSGGVPTTVLTFALPVIEVILDRTYVTGETVEVVVTYSGDPLSYGLTITEFEGEDLFYSDCQPYWAYYWWPCKDHPSDKADSLDVHVTVPNNMTAVSQGNLISVTDDGVRKTFHWQHRHPIVTYSVSVTCYPYAFFNDWYTPQAGGDPMEIVNYVFPSQVDSVQDNFLLAAPVMDFFAQEWGEYPFLDEKYGHAMFTRPGGMEHQTITSMSSWSEDLVVHELAHSWFGNHVTCADYGHLWLHEGFASWAEAYWKESTEGFATYQAYMQAAAFFGEGTIIVQDPDEILGMFDHDLRYNKASWVVHMLRWVLGDADFNTSLRQFLATYGGGNATTEDLQLVMEGISGLDLDQFFQQWIYGEYFPVYDYGWSQNGSTLDVNIQQVQTNSGLFAMPIEIQVDTDVGTERHVVQNSLVNEDYAFTVSSTVESVILDPDGWILRQVKIPTTNPLFTDGILLVNGVDLDYPRYTQEIFSAYEDSVFWDSHGIDFWDCFPETELGYPANLPAPLGHGPVPADIIGHYSTVIWIGNNYHGDLGSWLTSPIKDYLAVGGNVLLMSRFGTEFLDADLTAYAGITWREPGSYDELGDCTAVYPGLVDVPFMVEQTWNDVFDTAVGPNSTLLTTDTTGQPVVRGTGVHAQPPGGGSHRAEGGQLVYLAGRPYRMDHTALRSNVEFILEKFFAEPWGLTDVPDASDVVSARARLLPSYPNPFNPQTVIPLEIPRASAVELSVYDARGRLVRTLVAADLPAGRHEVTWNGLDGAGRAVASGTYFAKLRSGAVTDVKVLTLVR